MLPPPETGLESALSNRTAEIPGPNICTPRRPFFSRGGSRTLSFPISSWIAPSSTGPICSSIFRRIPKNHHFAIRAPSTFTTWIGQFPKATGCQRLGVRKQKRTGSIFSGPSDRMMGNNVPVLHLLPADRAIQGPYCRAHGIVIHSVSASAIVIARILKDRAGSIPRRSRGTTRPRVRFAAARP